MGSFPEVIEAGDCLLRPMAQVDLATVVEHLNDPRIARWMAAAREPFGIAEAEEILALACEPEHRIRVVAHGGAMVGCVGLMPDQWYWLDPSAQGAGIMRRALCAAIDAHFADPAPPLIARCRDDNAASLALLARLGFSRSPVQRRMFFAGEGRAMPCHDHVMTQEQWLMLHPPVQRGAGLTLRPAIQKDAGALMPMLPRAGEKAAPWPAPEQLSAFIEAHRCRVPGRGLFVVEDDLRRLVGMALLDRQPALRFLSPEEAERHTLTVTGLLAQ